MIHDIHLWFREMMSARNMRRFPNIRQLKNPLRIPLPSETETRSFLVIPLKPRLNIWIVVSLRQIECLRLFSQRFRARNARSASDRLTIPAQDKIRVLGKRSAVLVLIKFVVIERNLQQREFRHDDVLAEYLCKSDFFPCTEVFQAEFLVRIIPCLLEESLKCLRECDRNDISL